MILCGDTIVGTGERSGGGVGSPPPGLYSGGGRIRVERVKKRSLRNNKQRILGKAESLSEAVTSPPHD